MLPKYYPIFCKLTLWLALFLTFSTQQANAQTSFDLRIDGLTSGAFVNSFSNKMVACADGGYLMASTYYGNTLGCQVIKSDSSGNIEWIKFYSGGLSYMASPDLIGTSDSGFYLMINRLDFQFETFATPYLYKLDKFGNAEKSKFHPTNQFGVDGLYFAFGDVDSASNEVVMLGSFYSYDGSSGSCCSQAIAFKLDTLLNVIFSIRLDNGIDEYYRFINPKIKHVYLNNQIAGYLATGFLNNTLSKTFVHFIDTSGIILWTRNYSTVNFTDWVQSDSNFYLVANPQSFQSLESTIHKLDYFGNLLFSKRFQSTEHLTLTNIELSLNSRLLISGSSSPPLTGNTSSLAMITNLEVDSVQGMIGSDSSFKYGFFGLSIDSKTSAFMFAKEPIPNTAPLKAIFEKYSFGSSICNYTSLSVTPVADTILDSISVFTTIPYTINMFNYPTIYDTLDFIYSSPCLTTSIHESEPEVSTTHLSIQPNPVQDDLQISLTGKTISKGEIIIYNLTGETVLKVSYSETNINLPVSNLSSGIYFVKIISNGMQLNGKFVKL